MDLYLQFAPAIWRVTQRLFTVCAGITADVESSRSPGVCAQLQVDDKRSRLDHSYSPYLRDTRFVRGRYASAFIFVTASALLSIASNMMGLRTLKGYLTALCAAISGVVGYVTSYRRNS